MRTAGEMTLREKIWQVNWSLVLLIIATASVGFAMLYSAANGSFDPWAKRQMARFGVGFAIMMFIALLDIRFWLRMAYLAYAGALILLVVFGGKRGEQLAEEASR